MTNRELLAAGICENCLIRPGSHGPWTDAELKDVCDDIGVDPDDFVDWCGPCFVNLVTFGDVDWAQRLVGDQKLDLNPPLLSAAKEVHHDR